MEFRSRKVGDIPPALTSPLLPSFPFFEKPRPREPPPPPAAQQLEETDSPQSPSPDEEDGADTQPHRQKMLVQFPFQKRKATGPQETPSKESTGRLGSLLTRRMRVSSLYPMTGQITMVPIPPLGDGPYLYQEWHPEGEPSDAPPPKKPADGGETTPQQEQNLPAETTESVLIMTRNELYGKDIHRSRR